jgi:hypothetical protein
MGEPDDLGLRAQRAGVPSLLAGARVVDAGGAPWWVVEAPAGRLRLVDADSGSCFADDGRGLVLDLGYGATRGAVLDWLRAAYAEPNLCARVIGRGGDATWWCWAVGSTSFTDLPSGRSEAEALVLAAEALGARPGSVAVQTYPLPPHLRPPAPPAPPRARQRDDNKPTPLAHPEVQ